MLPYGHWLPVRNFFCLVSCHVRQAWPLVLFQVCRRSEISNLKSAVMRLTFSEYPLQSVAQNGNISPQRSCVKSAGLIQLFQSQHALSGLESIDSVFKEQILFTASSWIANPLHLETLECLQNEYTVNASLSLHSKLNIPRDGVRRYA